MLDEFNEADPAEAAEILSAVLDIAEWVTEISDRRPYSSVESLRSTGWTVSDRITWPQVAGALARHPRIGERAAATSGSRTEAAWSASEQSGVQANQITDLENGNRAYEERFGFLFLICAAGLTGDQILAGLTARLSNDLETEKAVVIGELRKIADLRLAKAVAG